MFHCLFALILLTVAADAAEPQHRTVAAEPGKFLGWPANHGPMRVWGNEIVVAFTAADFKVIGPARHAFDPAKPQHTWLARSLGSGATWTAEGVLRSGSGNWDIGCTRLAQLAGGRLITTYYWNTDPHKERTIEATIWTP